MKEKNQAKKNLKTNLEIKNIDKAKSILYASTFNTQLGEMIAINDKRYLYLLEFIDKEDLEKEIKKVADQLNATLTFSRTKIGAKIKKEIDLYFRGKKTYFETPVYFLGTSFQKNIWSTLLEVDFGKTISYKELANKIGNNDVQRAAGSAIGKNKIAIVIPCHRIIKSNGEFGEYANGSERKEFLINHEKSFIKK
ncbi:methylated-DNA--[protein]-cysteine S-methyltransferase [Mesoplasma chauliocola]|uniref:methylated-DNA--[protein]-cysteine S-methyltransferase n=1 Tax=Mesoplasma chauliocola TaxID=216427 RepID=A0A249SP26_9MOLU|nr:methylated-DNA--[protein]-cysteine S-methyltransferase [Mesoplasma chauliocola]ASZ09424.1 methylated-DNA--[protein]-cysteine S-methyltransferase [Mesoplasma chauliocola]